MKHKLDLKTLLLATLACLVYTGMEFFQESISAVSWYSLQDFKVILFWAVVLIGWAIYFLDRFKRR